MNNDEILVLKHKLVILREALASKDMAERLNNMPNKVDMVVEAIKALQGDAEPVAWIDDENRFVTSGWVNNGGYVDKDRAIPSTWQPLYTSPPKREWVGLTSGMLDRIIGDYDDDYDLAIKLEQKLRELNT